MLAIGDELLAGRVDDVNLSWLARTLQARGVDVVRAEFVPDEVGTIVESLKRLRAVVGEDGIVVTSGGIGPTHDDRTYEAVAKYACVDLEVHDATVEAMKEHYEQQGKEVNSARLRMATLPTGCIVHTTPGLWVPLVECQSVWVLPGIPRLFSAMVEANVERFKGEAVDVVTLYTALGEGDLADKLRAIAEEFEPQGIAIGSYPQTHEGQNYTTKITLSSRKAEVLAAALAAVRAQIDVADEPQSE